MNKIIFFVGVLVTMVPLTNALASNSDNSQNLAVSLSQWLVDMISRKILALFRLFDLKLRLVQFLSSLYTTENLLLLRNVIEYAVSFGNTTLRFLPTSTSSGAWLETFLTGILDLNLLGSLGFTIPMDDHIEGAASELSENEMQAPVVFHEHVGDQIHTEFKEENHFEDKREISKQDKELLNTYGNRIMSLDKLINARK